MPQQPLRGICADRKRSYFSIEQDAGNLRRLLQLEPLVRFDARSFYDEVLPDSTVACRSGIITLREAVEECVQEGLTRWNADAGVIEVVLSGETYDSLQRDHVRARSTVAHELGHAYLHTDQIIGLAGMSLTSQVALHRERSSHQACEDTEWQANAFASALLVPAEGVQRLFLRLNRHSESEIAEQFGVSMELAHYRILTYERALDFK